MPVVVRTSRLSIENYQTKNAFFIASVDPAANPGNIDDIPDLDGPSSISNNLDLLTISGDGPSNTDGEAPEDIPDMDNIPDMEEEGLEAAEDEATVKPATGSLT